MSSTAHTASRRPLLGLRHTPGRLALWVFRVPVVLYRRGLGWVLGRTFLELVHVGRRTGRCHSTVAMVLADDPSTGEVVICSAWGPDADWLHNLRAGPATQVTIGRSRFVPTHRFMDDGEAVTVGMSFRRRHPQRLWLLSHILGWGDLKDDGALQRFVRDHPFVALRPA